MILEIQGGPAHGSKLHLEGLDVPDFVQFAYKDRKTTEHFDRFATYSMKKGTYKLVTYTDGKEQPVPTLPQPSTS